MIKVITGSLILNSDTLILGNSHRYSEPMQRSKTLIPGKLTNTMIQVRRHRYCDEIKVNLILL